MRDRESDDARRDRILQSVATVIEQIQREEKGLADRYDKASASAGMALQVAEGEGSSSGVDLRLDELERSVTYCAKRIAELKAQREFYSRLSDTVRDHGAV